jgi:CRP-like cAMP-binding protein
MEGIKKFLTKFKKGDVIYSEEEIQENLYIIHKGKVQLVKEDGILLITLTKGDFFGEESLGNSKIASCSAECIEDSDIIKISYDYLKDMMDKNKDISLKILNNLSVKNQKIRDNLYQLMQKPMERIEVPKSPPKDKTSEKLNPDTKAYLIIQRSNRIVQLTKKETYLGRRDYTTGYIPDIDLTKEDEEKYISRKHAKVVFINNKFYVSEEAGAVNGTFLKGNKLKTGIKYELSNEDEITLCHLNIIFKY